MDTQTNSEIVSSIIEEELQVKISHLEKITETQEKDIKQLLSLVNEIQQKAKHIEKSSSENKLVPTIKGENKLSTTLEVIN